MKRILQIGLLAGGLLFFCTTLFAQCDPLYSQTEFNTTLLNEKTLGQSFVAACSGPISFITVQCNRVEDQINDITLRIWEEIPGTGQSVIYIQNGVTISGKAVPTQISVTGGNGENEITSGKNYYFTLSHNSLDLELHAESIGTFVPGYAVKDNLMPTDPLVPIGTTDLYFIIEADIATPVELTHFSANLQSNRRSVQLDWSTTSEIENRGFAIEKSADGREWKEIAFVSGAGNSDIIEYYDFTDAYPFLGTNYYRLKQLDFNGDFEYSPVEVVDVKSDRPFEIYPNPARAFVNIAIAENQVGESMLVLDAFGRMVHQVSALNSGLNEIAIDHLPVGVYTLQLSSGVSSRFIKTD